MNNKSLNRYNSLNTKFKQVDNNLSASKANKDKINDSIFRIKTSVSRNESPERRSDVSNLFNTSQTICRGKNEPQFDSIRLKPSQSFSSKVKINTYSKDNSIEERNNEIEKIKNKIQCCISNGDELVKKIINLSKDKGAYQLLTKKPNLLIVDEKLKDTYNQINNAVNDFLNNKFHFENNPPELAHNTFSKDDLTNFINSLLTPFLESHFPLHKELKNISNQVNAQVESILTTFYTDPFVENSNDKINFLRNEFQTIIFNLTKNIKEKYLSEHKITNEILVEILKVKEYEKELSEKAEELKVLDNEYRLAKKISTIPKETEHFKRSASRARTVNHMRESSNRSVNNEILNNSLSFRSTSTTSFEIRPTQRYSTAELSEKTAAIIKEWKPYTNNNLELATEIADNTQARQEADRKIKIGAFNKIRTELKKNNHRIR